MPASSSNIIVDSNASDPDHPAGVRATVKVEEAGQPGCEFDIVATEATMQAPAR